MFCQSCHPSFYFFIHILLFLISSFTKIYLSFLAQRAEPQLTPEGGGGVVWTATWAITPVWGLASFFLSPVGNRSRYSGLYWYWTTWKNIKLFIQESIRKPYSLLRKCFFAPSRDVPVSLLLSTFIYFSRFAVILPFWAFSPIHAFVWTVLYQDCLCTGK